MGLGDMNHKSKSLKKAEKENTRRKLLTTECNSPYSALVREFLESAEMLDGAPSAASPLSVLDQKAKFIKRVARLGYSEDQSLFVTIIPHWAMISVKDFSTEEVLRIKQKFQRHMRRSATRGCHGGLFVLDFTIFKEPKSQIQKNRYKVQVHFHGVMHHDDGYILQALSQTRGFNGNAWGVRPILAKTVSDREGVASYCMKYRWQLKPSWVDKKTGRFRMRQGVAPPKRVFLKFLSALVPIKPKELEIRLGARRHPSDMVEDEANAQAARSDASDPTKFSTERKRRRLFFPALDASSIRGRNRQHLTEDYWW